MVSGRTDCVDGVPHPIHGASIFPGVPAARPALRCPKCGRTFANRNQWHSCGVYRVDDLLMKADPQVADLYRRFERMVRRCGPVVVSPTKTLIAFKLRATFAACVIEKRALRVGVLLARRHEDPRFVKVVSVAQRSHEHVFRVERPEDLDDTVQAWLREAYHLSEKRHPRRDAAPTRSQS